MPKKRQYPFKAWTLQPSFKPVEIELVHDSWYAEHHTTSKGQLKHEANIFHTKQEAIAEGRARLDEQEAKLNKSLEKVAKKRAALDKAERQ